VKSPSSYLVEVGGARKVYHVNDLRKYHIRIDYTLCDDMCIGMPQNYSCTDTGTENTCAVMYEKDADFGRINVVEPTQSESEVVGDAEPLPSRKIPPPRSSCSSQQEKAKQLLAVLDKYP